MHCLEIDEFRELFKLGNMEISDSQFERFSIYSDMLYEWNQKINLTAITDNEGITLKHFYDSVYPFTLFDFPENSTVIDVGTGAGFPSCPLKIYRDDVKLTLLDSLNKRVKFLSELSNNIALNADCIHGRAEEFGRKIKYREKFDIATARAVANLAHLCEYCLPFVKVGGAFIALKGSGGKEELENARNAIKVLGGKVENVIEYELPNGDARCLIIVRKLKSTDYKFPRNKGKMEKQPL